jgi:hypothetical protein
VADIKVELTNFGTCRACGQVVGWILLPGGVKRPVDPEPSRSGEYAMHKVGDGVKAVALETAEQRIAWSLTTQYRSHFNTCPQQGLVRAAYSAISAIDRRGNAIQQRSREADRARNLARDRARDFASGGRKYFR